MTPSSTPAPSRDDSLLPWISFGLAIVVSIIQATFAYTTGRSLAAGEQAATSALVFVSLVASVAIVVLSTVALAQRSKNTWASLIALGIGANVLVISIASWLGSLASTSL